MLIVSEANRAIKKNGRCMLLAGLLLISIDGVGQAFVRTIFIKLILLP